MTTYRPFTCADLFRFSRINLDPLTETYGISFYLTYLSKWPEYFVAAEAPCGKLQGYIMAKAEGHQPDFSASYSKNESLWHGHVTALTVDSSSRRAGLARCLMDHVEAVSDKRRCFFVDLFVRNSNTSAIAMYQHLGYSLYRRVIQYYTGGAAGDEDAWDMRKALSRDRDKTTVIPLDHPVMAHEVD